MFMATVEAFEKKLREQGREIGIKQGLIQGQERGMEIGLITGERYRTVETAHRLMREGMESAHICRIIGISEQDLNELLTDLEKITMIAECKNSIKMGLEEHERRTREQGREQGFPQGLKQGFSLGVEQGLEQGGRRNALETARRMKVEGWDTDHICRITDLSYKDLKEL